MNILYWSQLLTRSFYNDPLFQYAFTGTELQRSSAMQTYFDIAIDECLQQGYIITSPENSGIAAWVPASEFPPHIDDNRISNQTPSFKAGWQRFVQHEVTPEHIISTHAKNFGYLWLVCVDDAYRGKGYGVWLLEELCTQMQQAGLRECWLSTEAINNIAFYTKAGFELFEQAVASSGLTSYVFRKNIMK